MRDYIAWYLVELRRRLSSHDSQKEVEDLILETRTHLQESIDDMTARGIHEEAAVKSAIIDFGPPAAVAAATKGERISTKLYWMFIAVIVLLAIPTIGQLVMSSTDNALGWTHVSTFEFGTTTTSLLAGIALLAAFSRK